MRAEETLDVTKDLKAVNRRFASELARAIGGALLFFFPMLMTMEMWWLGFTIDKLRLALMQFLALPLLFGLAHFIGFDKTRGWRDNLRDVFIAYGVGFVTSALLLMTFAIIEPGMSRDVSLGIVSVQTIPASIGAMLARSQFGEQSDREKRATSYGGHLFYMLVGAIFLSFSVAATEEMMLIAYKMTSWNVIALMALSLLSVHGFVSHAQTSRDHATTPPGTPAWSRFFRHTAVGYAAALLVGGYVLWTFGRTEGLAFLAILKAVVVVGFPASLGAGAARVIL